MTANENDYNKAKFNKLVTSMDVAKLAGVSQSSVSRVFNPTTSREVKEETRNRVLKAAKELGYRPNFIARSMVSRRTGIIGVVVGSPLGPFHNKVIADLLGKLQEKCLQCLIFTVETGQNIDDILQRVLQYQVDGIVITAAALSNDMANICISNDIPIILFNRFIPGLNVSSVYCDNIEAGRSVGRLFGEAGFKNITHITYLKDTVSAMERRIGFYGELREYGIHNIKEIRADYTQESGFNIGMDLFKQENIPDAIFCTSDLIAIGIMDAARYKFGLKIPQDISIVGFDDIEMAAWPSYNLSTVCQPLELLVDNTIEILMTLIEGDDLTPIYKMVKTHLVVRGTTINSK